MLTDNKEIFCPQAKFITSAEFATVEPIYMYHLQQEQFEYSHPEDLKNVHIKMRRVFSFSPKAGIEIGGAVTDVNICGCIEAVCLTGFNAGHWP